MKKAVIFDLDGTLADTLESIAYCTNRSLRDCGLDTIDNREEFKRFVGNGAKMLVVRALRRIGDPEGSALEKPDADDICTCPIHTEEVLERYMQYFEKDCMYQVKPYEGICELLRKLKASGIRTAVFSNKPHENTEYVISSLFGEECFDVVQGQTAAMRAKPAPDGVFEILKKLSLKKEDILYVGDSCVDMDTGKAAGVKTIGVLWGFRDRPELLAHGADDLIERPQELLDLLWRRGGGSMHEYDDAVLQCFLKRQEQLFPEAVASGIEEAEAFLEDCMAVVVNSAEEVREYFEEAGIDMEDADNILDAEEVFEVGDGRYLIVEG